MNIRLICGRSTAAIRGQEIRSGSGIGAVFAALAIVLCSSLQHAVAAPSYSDSFPSASSSVIASVGQIRANEFGYFWSVSRGDSVSQAFVGTGLTSVDQLDLDFDITQNVLSVGESTNWDVLLNNVVVGNWTWSDTSGTGNLPLSFNFPSIVGNGSYTIAMIVTNEVPGGPAPLP